VLNTAGLWLGPQGAVENGGGVVGHPGGGVGGGGGGGDMEPM